MARGDVPATEELRDLVSRPLSDPEVARALDLLTDHPAVERARAEITRRAEVARGHLAAVPDGAAKRGLLDLCAMVVTRSS